MPSVLASGMNRMKCDLQMENKYENIFGIFYSYKSLNRVKQFPDFISTYLMLYEWGTRSHCSLRVADLILRSSLPDETIN